MKNIYLLCSALFIFTSCYDKGKVEVTNALGGVALEHVSFGGATLSYGELLPGESTKEFEFNTRVDKVKFPIHGEVKFYMTRGDNKAYLETKEIFTLEKGQTLRIVIKDNTEVVNPISGYYGDIGGQ